MTIEAAKRGYAFATVRPRGDRNFETKTINLVFVVEEGTRAYIERINIRGNTRTRDYVIRREFDIGEGDAYNRALIDRAERRLKNLNYFKTVKITNEPGSAPDRVVINVDVEEMSTGEFSIAGGYSTADGFIGEVSVADRNLLGRGQFAKAAVQLRPAYARLRPVVRRALSARLPHGRRHRPVCAAEPGVDHTCPMTRKRSATNLRLGFALTRRTGVSAALFDLPAGNHAAGSSEQLQLYQRIAVTATPACIPATGRSCPAIDGCYADGEASLAGAQGTGRRVRSLVSLVGYSLAYNTLDNNKTPTSGLFAELKQDFAGVGGDVNFIRSTRRSAQLLRSASRTSSACSSCRAAMLPAGAARTCACWITSRWARTWCAALRRPASVRAI